jgi:hypothetical protein
VARHPWWVWGKPYAGGSGELGGEGEGGSGGSVLLAPDELAPGLEREHDLPHMPMLPKLDVQSSSSYSTQPPPSLSRGESSEDQSERSHTEEGGDDYTQQVCLAAAAAGGLGLIGYLGGGKADMWVIRAFFSPFLVGPHIGYTPSWLVCSCCWGAVIRPRRRSGPLTSRVETTLGRGSPTGRDIFKSHWKQHYFHGCRRCEW